MITPAELIEGEGQPARSDIFFAALMTFCSMNGPHCDASSEVEMEKMKKLAADIGCDSRAVLDDLQTIHTCIGTLRKQIVEGAP